MKSNTLAISAIVASLIVVAAVLTVLTQNDSKVDTVDSQHSEPEASFAEATNYPEVNTSQPNISSAIDLDPHPVEVDSGAEVAETTEQPEDESKLQSIFKANPALKSWATDRGYWSENSSEYSDYDENSLMVLAKSSNLEATQILSERLTAQSRLDEAEVWSREAAALGSSKALINLAQINLSQSTNPELTDAQREAHLTSANAWLLVSSNRQDPFATVAGQYLQLGDKDSWLKNPKVVALAEDLHSELVKQRYAKGLSDFEDVAFPGDDISFFQYLNE